MKLILLNLRDLWKNQRIFFAIMVLVQALCAFCLTFIIGVIINNHHYIGFRLIDTLYIDMNGVKYKDVEKTMVALLDNELESAVNDVLIAGYVEDENAQNGVLNLWAQVTVENGRYVPGPYMKDLLPLQMVKGRILTEEELNSSEPIGMITNYNSDEVIVNGIKYDVVGERKVSTTASTLYVSPINLREVENIGADFYLKRYVTEEEYNTIIDEFNKVVPGGIRISDNSEGDGDEKALMRSAILACCLIGIVLIGTLVIVYQHILDKRNNKLAIFRLNGCTSFKSMFLMMVEMLIVSIPSLILGFAMFKILQEKKLESLYPYMDPYINFDMYVRLFLGMLGFLVIFFIVLSGIRAMKSVKKQLIMITG